jgi:hypothetical protein
VGEWLGQALDRLGKSEAENERLRQRATDLTKLCSDRLVQRWDDNAEYRAEISRLRAEIDKQRLVSESVFDEYSGSDRRKYRQTGGGDDE